MVGEALLVGRAWVATSKEERVRAVPLFEGALSRWGGDAAIVVTNGVAARRHVVDGRRAGARVSEWLQMKSTDRATGLAANGWREGGFVVAW
jgi:hypothetical protein